MRFPYIFPIILIGWLASVGCAPQPESETAGQAAWVSILPQQAMVETVAGDRVAVNVMVRPGQSPETYSPSVPQMAALAKADLYFGIGMPLERVILAKMKRSMPQLKFVQTADMVQANHDHVHDATCVHGDQDPHVWMDPVWMIGFVEQVRESLIALEPEAADFFNANAASVSQRLRELDATLTAQLKPYAGRSFYINHPSLGHFAERYGLVQKSIEHSGSAPSAKQIADLVQLAKVEQVGAIFTQPEFGRSSADVLANALDVEVITVDVLNADYFSNMLDIAQSLQDSFE